MACTAKPRGFTDVLVPWADLIDNNPCGKPDYAAGLCSLHWQMQNGLIRPAPGVDQYTVFLLHADGPDGSTVVTDSVGHPLTAVGSAQIDTAQSQFGGASLLLNGTTDGLTTPDSPDFAFGSGDFTIDCWVRFNVINAISDFVSQWGGAPNYGFNWRYETPSTLKFLYSLDGTAALAPTFAWTPTTGVWYHVALVRNGNNLLAFVNGTQVGTTQTITGALFDSSYTVSFGARGVAASEWLNGWMDEIRVSKGIARWTAPFSPPTAPY